MKVTEKQLITISDLGVGPDHVGMIDMKFYMHEDKVSVIMERKYICYSMEPGRAFRPEKYEIVKTKISPSGENTFECEEVLMEKKIQDSWDKKHEEGKEARRKLLEPPKIKYDAEGNEYFSYPDSKNNFKFQLSKEQKEQREEMYQQMKKAKQEAGIE